MEESEEKKAGDSNDTDAECKLFLFDFKESASVLWIIAVPNATNTLYLCQLDPSLTHYDLTCELLNHSIWFYTLVPMPSIRPSPPLPITIPAWLSGYQFMSKDYYAYVQQHCALSADCSSSINARWNSLAASHGHTYFDEVLYEPYLQN
jgi:hypothetical protein